MPKQLSLSEFIRRFPDDSICLEIIFRMRFGGRATCHKCGIENPKYYRISTRKAYECGKCKYQIYPCAGTMFQQSTTRLTIWFQAMFLFSVSKNGVSTQELQRALGTDYRTAWRIGHKIRLVMSKSMDKQMFSGDVEVDETLLGGVARGGKRGWGAPNKVCLVGIIQRGGSVRITPVVNRNREQIFALIKQYVEKGATINTDEFRAYNTLPQEGYQHQTVVHSKYQWSDGNAHTNSIEGYWSNLKKSVRGTHTHVSSTYLSNYLAEFDFKHTHRHSNEMFEFLFAQAIEP